MRQLTIAVLSAVLMIAGAGSAWAAPQSEVVLPNLPPRVHLEFMCPNAQVFFAAGSSTLDDEATSDLLAQYQNIKAHCVDSEIEGIAYTRENVADPQDLAKRRAKAVADFLVKAGENPNRVSIILPVQVREDDEGFNPKAVNGAVIRSGTGP